MAQRKHVNQPQTSKIQLLDFAKRKEYAYWSLHQQAMIKARNYGITIVESVDNKGVIVLQYFKNGKPVFYTTNNVIAAASVSADLLWPENSNELSLTGKNVEIGLWDGGSPFDQHQEFINNTGAIWQRDGSILTLNHTTHVAGTINAEGADPDSRGVAKEARLLAYDFNNDEAEIAVAASEELLVSNHSYGKVCGWSYNTLNENWFWHGDLTLSQSEDLDFGHYDSICWSVDYIAYHAPYYLMVKSAGNDRFQGPVSQPVEHYNWNEGWYKNDDIHEVDGGSDGYKSLCSMAVSKNNLVVGAVQDLPDGYFNETGVVIEDYSACGPTNDGRIKPDVVANGSDVYSSIADATDAYASYSGTSMSAANATGAIGLLLQMQQKLQPGVFLWSSTMKGLIIHTADECGDSAGPDYRYGYGLINAYKAVMLLQNNANSGGKLIVQDSVGVAESKKYGIEVAEGIEQLKVTLCWTDPPGTVNDLTQGESARVLVNDLNLIIRDAVGNIVCYPWILDPANPEIPASTGVNHVDNVEQILIKQPESGIYEIEVSGFDLQNCQRFSLITEGNIIDQNILPPKQLSYRNENSAIRLFWNHPVSQPSFYKVYMNGMFFRSVTDTTCLVGGLTNGEMNSYYVTAVFAGDREVESLPTNTIEVASLMQEEIPYLSSFENGVENWSIKQDCNGWKWGCKDSLTSYYLNFEGNNTKFLWIDSGVEVGTTHVSDVAYSAPINLENKTNIWISFNYVFMSGIYDVIDELHVVCRQIGDENWTEIAEVIPRSKWTQASFYIPDSLAKSNVQIGFYYDDFYQKGMGAAIDEVIIEADIPNALVALNNENVDISICRNKVKLRTAGKVDQKITWSVCNMLGKLLCMGDDVMIDGRLSFEIPGDYAGVVILRIKINGKMYCSKMVMKY